jgi:hypothetical protein
MIYSIYSINGRDGRAGNKSSGIKRESVIDRVRKE